MADLQPKKSGDSVVEDGEDRLSQLPSGVLSHILSFLSMKDAARTSVLSKDWIWRWLSVDDLYFDVREFYEDEVLWFFTAGLAVNMRRHVEWVSSVLRAHQAAMLEIDGEEGVSVIKKLRVRMPMCKTYQENMDEWISYAFARKVETLELRLASQYARCSFPTRLVDRNLVCLKSLSLVGVNVTDEDVKVFLRKFRFLEYLKLCLSDKLETVEVYGPLTLKHLEILDCSNLRYAIVWNTSLVSLTVTRINRVLLQQNPKLVVLRAGGWLWDAPIDRILNQLSVCFPRLESLTLEADYCDDEEVIAEVPQLSEVKQLTIIGHPGRIETLVRITALLSLSPKLEKLIFEFGDMRGWEFVRMDYVAAVISGNRPMIPLQHLRAVEVREYYGGAAEDGLLKYFFKYVMAPIATVTFDPNNLHREMPVAPRRQPKEMSAEMRAAQLQTLIPPAIEFIVI